jgi:hypothetical protein
MKRMLAEQLLRVNAGKWEAGGRTSYLPVARMKIERGVLRIIAETVCDSMEQVTDGVRDWPACAAYAISL